MSPTARCPATTTRCLCALAAALAAPACRRTEPTAPPASPSQPAPNMAAPPSAPPLAPPAPAPTAPAPAAPSAGAATACMAGSWQLSNPSFTAFMQSVTPAGSPAAMTNVTGALTVAFTPAGAWDATYDRFGIDVGAIGMTVHTEVTGRAGGTFAPDANQPGAYTFATTSDSLRESATLNGHPLPIPPNARQAAASTGLTHGLTGARRVECAGDSLRMWPDVGAGANAPALQFTRAATRP